MIQKSIKKIFENRFIKILIETFFILFLFLMIFLSILYVVSSYKDVLKRFGIYVKDDCKLEDSKIVCNYINITDKKEFNVNLENVSAFVKFSELFKFKSFIDLEVEKVSGEYINDLTAPPLKKFKFIFPLYLFTSYVNFNVKNGDFKVKNVDKDLDLHIKNISAYNRQNKVFINSNIHLTFLQKENSHTLNIIPSNSYQIKVFPKEMIVENIKISYNSLTADIKNISLHEDKTVKLTGKVNAPNYSYRGITLSGLDADIFFKMKKEKEIKVNGDIKQVSYESIDIINNKINIKIKITEKDKKEVLFGKSDFKIGILKTPDINLKDLFITSDIEDKNGLKIKGKYDIKLSYGNFEYIESQKKLHISSQIPSLEKVISILPIKKDEIINSLNANISAESDYFLDKKQLNILLNSKNFTAVGLKFSDLSGVINLSLKDYSLYADLKGFSGNQRVFTKGYVRDFNDIKKLSYNFNIDATNFVLQNLMYLKDIPIKSTLNTSGKIYGDFHNIFMDFTGNAMDFSYEEISLKNIHYNFSLKNDTITVKANDGKSLYSDFTFYIPNEKLELKINFTKQFDLQAVYPFLLNHSKEVFERVIPKSTEGFVYITSIKKDWNVNLNIKNGEIYLKDIQNTVFADISGFIDEKDIKLNINFSKENLTIKENRIKNVSGNIRLANKDLKFYGVIDGLNEFKSFKFTASGNYNINDESFNVTSEMDLTDDKSSLQSNLNLKIKGSFNDYKGSLSGYVKNTKKLDLSFDIKGDKNKVLAYGKKINFSEKDINLNIDESLITVNLNKENFEKSMTVLMLKNIIIKEKDIPLIKFSDFKINYYDKKLYTDKQVFTGSFVGSIDRLLYDVDKNYLELTINGNLDRKYLSQIIQYVNVDGKIKFALAYKGSPENILEKASFKLYGEDVRVKTPYTTNIISFDKFDITLKNNLFIDITGFTRSSYGESSIKVNGKYNLKNKEGDIKVISELLPIKYQNIYNGIISTNTDIKLIKDKIYINSKTLTTGKVKIEPEYLDQKSESIKKPDILKNIHLDIDLSTLSPVFIEGTWGRVYGDGKFDIKGTAEKPIVNGNLRISYGKVDFLKNRYNVDFIDLKLTDNKTYVNGRLSTNISGTYIYVNVSGTADNLRYDFFSTPPKSKDEILSLLLIKKTPEQLASSGLFSVVSSVAKLIVPFRASGEEEEGLFGTGFNVNIIPSYNPVQGITFNVYVQKYLTRKIYLGFSKPLATTIINQYGFYEGGYRLTERSSVVFRFYDNNARSTDITFTYPFDF